MKTQKPVLKSAYCFAGLLILVLIGFNIYQYQQINKLSEKTVPEKIVKNESTSDSQATPFKMAQKSKMKSVAPVSKEEKSNTSEIDELEYQLNAAEEELDMANAELSDELSKKAEYIKARDQYVKNMLSNPTFKKKKRDALSLNLGNDFDPLFKKLNISKEEFDEFKGLLADKMMEIDSISASIIGASSDEEKTKAIQQSIEIREKYENKISEFLGEENETYQSYLTRLTERRSLNEFIETLSPDNRIDEDQTEVLINSMYEARKAANTEMGSGSNMRSILNTPEDMKEWSIERTKQIYEEYVETSRGMLSPEQVEQYEKYLQQKIDMEESRLKMSYYLNDSQ